MNAPIHHRPALLQSLRRTFLARATARFYMVEHGEITVDEAFNGLVPAFRDLDTAADLCRQWELQFPPVKAKRRRAAA
jgi:hypothetical protein